MTTERGRLLALSRVIEHQRVGGYDLPGDVLEAHSAYQRAQAIPVPERPALRHPDTAATALVDQLASGQDVDLLATAGDITAAQDEARRVDVAQQLYALVVERVGERTSMVAIGAADRIITEHLRPAHTQVLDDAHGHAAKLGGASLDGPGWDAPAKVRTARRELAELADRLRAIRTARLDVITLAEQTPEHDTGHNFALLRRPQALAPGLSPGPRMLPRLDVPADPVSMLVWLVTVAEPAEPWLPSTAEQDAAWFDVFGQAQQARRAAAVSARANAGASV